MSASVSEFPLRLQGIELADVPGYGEVLSGDSVAKLLESLRGVQGIAERRQVSEALAPFVVGVVRREILESREVLADSVYPLIGSMIRAYLANGVHEKLWQFDRAIARTLSLKNSWLRLRALLTGTSFHELLRKAYNAPSIEEILLIRKGAGHVVDRWQNAAPQQHAGANGLVSGLLSAINSFADEALAHDNGSLRALDLGTSRLYLRTTNAFIIAVRCAGPASPALERAIDRELLVAIERHGSVFEPAQRASGRIARSFIPGLAKRLDAVALRSAIAAAPSGRMRPVYALTVITLLGMSAVGTLSQQIIVKAQALALEHRIETAIRNDPVLSQGADIAVSVSASEVSLKGTVPSAKAAQDLVEIVKQAGGALPIVGNVALGVVSTVDNTLDQVLGALRTTVPATVGALVRPVEGVAGAVLREVPAVVSQTTAVVNDTVATARQLLRPVSSASLILGPDDLNLGDGVTIGPLALDFDADSLAKAARFEPRFATPGASAWRQQPFVVAPHLIREAAGAVNGLRGPLGSRAGGAVAQGASPLGSAVGQTVGSVGAVAQGVGGVTQGVGSTVRGLGSTVGGTASRATGSVGRLLGR